jgi:uncharacterized protein
MVNVRTVFDTNVIVSALLAVTGIPRRAFDSVLAHGRVLVSAATVGELEGVLRRPKFDKYIREDERLEFLAAMLRTAEVVEVTEVVTDCRDPKDNKFLELAVSGHASQIVAGDADLLVLHPFRGITIVNPQNFLAGLSVSGT